MLQFAALAADRDAELPFEMVKPVFQTMAATAKLGGSVPAQPEAAQAPLADHGADVGRAGAADTLIPEAHARTYAAEIPGATYQEIGDARTWS